MSHRLALTVLMLSLTIGLGCAKSDRMNVYATSGQVTLDGKPVGNAHVALIPVDKEKFPRERPHGITDDQGRFTLSTYLQNDGAPEGDFQVAIRSASSLDDDGSDQRKANTLPAIYADPSSSGIKVTIKPGKNELPAFALKK